MRTPPTRRLLLCVAFALALQTAYAGRLVDRHVPDAAREFPPISDVPAANQLHLAIGLSVRDPAAVQAFVNEVSDPRSANFRQYLTPEQFTERFGPSEQEYQAVI